MIGLDHHVTSQDLRVGKRLGVRVDRATRYLVLLEHLDPMMPRLRACDRFDLFF